MKEAFLASRSLVRGLTHQLRTPLSVIQNELAYISSLVPQGECERAIRNCNAISEILKELNIIDKAELKSDKTDVLRLLSPSMVKACPPDLATLLRSRFLLCDAEKVKQAFLLISRLFEKCNAVTFGLGSSEAQSALKLMFSADKECEIESVNSFSEFHMFYKNNDSFLPAQIDILLWSGKLTYVISATKKEVILNINFDEI